MADKYLFGVYNSIDALVQKGEEGLRLDTQGNYTGNIEYNGNYGSWKIQGSSNWYEVDLNKPIDAQLDYRQMGRYVNETAMDNYRQMNDNLLSKLDLGGVTEKDRLKATEDETGIFSFGLAAPSLYRVVEWYVPELDKVVDSAEGVIDNVNGSFYFKPDATPNEPNPKTYRCLRQQKGTFDILKNVHPSRRVEVSENFYAADPSSGIGADGQEYRLKYGTREKKIFLKRPKAGGNPPYVDIFVIAGGLQDLNSMGMVAKITPVVMLAQQLEQAGAKVRIYGLRAYTVSGSEIGKSTSNNYNVYLSWVAKEYGAPIDVNNIALVTADPRFFRWQLWQLTEGIARAGGVNLTGYGSTIYGGTNLTQGFQLYKNFLMSKKEEGSSTSRVTDKALLITGSLSSPSNNWDRNEDAIEEEFYRLADMSEILLAKKPDKAIRRIVKRERDKGRRDATIRNRLLTLFNDAFYTRDASVLGTTAKKFADSAEYIEQIRKRREEIENIVRREVP